MMSGIISRIFGRGKKREYEYIGFVRAQREDETAGKGEQSGGGRAPGGFRRLSGDPLQNILLNILDLPDGRSILEEVYSQKTSVCLMAHLVFYYLVKSTNLENISLVISNILKSQAVRRRIHQFPWDCQGLPEMIKAVNRCCTLYKEKDKLEDCSDADLQRVCTDAVKLFDHVLIPLVKRKNEIELELEYLRGIESEERRKEEQSKIENRRDQEDEAHKRILKAVEVVLETFTNVLRNFTEHWPVELENPLKVFLGRVPQIIAEGDMEGVKLKEGVRAFAEQIPIAFEAFRESDGEEWKRVLQGLCNPDASGVSSLCKIWRLLVTISGEDAYEFLGSLLKVTVGSILESKPVEGRILRVESDIAETITGDINNVLLQCKSDPLNDKKLYRDFIVVEVEKLARRHGKVLKRECPGMYEYISVKMVRLEQGEDYDVMNITSYKVKILFVAANPSDIQPLALDEEIREIENKIRAAKFRDSLIMIQKWAARYDDLQQALLEHKPHIVHFSGHGTSANEIVLKGTFGKAQPINQEALKELFEILKDNIRGVILNACYSNMQAKAITEVIDFSIGMKKGIGDKAAILFAASFYRAIGFNKSVKEAFDLAVNSLKGIGIPDGDYPELLVRDGVDPSDIYLLGRD